MSIYPDIRIILGSKDILSELNNVLTVKSDEPAILSYDTTFNVGDFFVSVLVFRHVLFKNGVTIPSAFLVFQSRIQPISVHPVNGTGFYVVHFGLLRSIRFLS